MRAKDFILQESQGGILRRAQEVAQGKTVTFTKDGQTIDLVDAVVIPEGPELKFETSQELEDSLKEKLQAMGNPTVLYYSKLQKNHGVALVTLWKKPNNEKVAFVKFVQSKSPGIFSVKWANTDFTKETGWAQTNSKVAERAKFKLKPNELFQTDVDLKITNLPNLIKPRTDLPEDVSGQIKELLSNLVKGVKNPVAGAENYLTTYEVDLGESAAPIALTTGNFVSGSYKEAEKALLAPLGLTWRSIKSVLFPGAGSNLLYDSYLRLNKNTTLKVSSKDKKGGAAASVTGLVKEIEENPDRFKSISDDPNYLEVLNIVKKVSKLSAVDGPLQLAVDFEIITPNESQEIKNRWGKGLKYTPDASWATTTGVKAALARKGAKFNDPAYDMGFHMLAGVAELVADRINKMPNLDKFFRAILERSTMIQVKSTMSKMANGASFSNFQVIYPPVFTGNIKVIAGNNYMATRRPIGRLSFKIG